ncbi:MAG TPA: peptidase S1, partial [Candidatus Baltobacteraceae bacterium]|nr:peptidase S1 [Candidatus Baltobacteraceae bacterium]
ALNVMPDLANAMKYDPDLKISLNGGYYDLATPFYATVYTLDHLNLPPQLRSNVTYGFYDSGHMVYLHPAALAAFHDDLERWYGEVLRH